MVDNEKTLWQAGANRVTTSFIHMHRRTVAMRDIDLVELHRPFLALTLPLAAMMTLVGVRFHEVMTDTELSVAMVLPWIAAALSAEIAQLRLHSYSLKDLEILMPVWRARAMRAAIDQAMAERHTGGGPKGV